MRSISSAWARCPDLTLRLICRLVALSTVDLRIVSLTAAAAAVAPIDFIGDRRVSRCQFSGVLSRLFGFLSAIVLASSLVSSDPLSSIVMFQESIYQDFDRVGKSFCKPHGLAFVGRLAFRSEYSLAIPFASW